MNKIKLSVIIPTFNSSNTLERLIDSLINQDFNDFEIIFIDDNSSDNTVEIINNNFKYSNINYQLFINKTNMGPAYCRNIGLDNSKGKFIVFIDSDDVVREDHFSSLLNNNDFCDSVFIKGLKLDNEEKLLDFKENKFYPILKLVDENNIIKSNDLIRLELLMQIPFSFVLLLYKKDILLKNKIKFNEDFRYGEDTDFAIKYLTNCNNVKFVDKYTYYYYEEADSISKSSSLKRFEFIRLLEDLSVYLDLRGKTELSNLVIYSRIPRSIFGNMNYFFYNDYDKDEIFKKMDELDLFTKLKDFKVYSKGDWKFKLKINLFFLNPNIYYKLWRMFKNSI